MDLWKWPKWGIDPIIEETKDTVYDDINEFKEEDPYTYLIQKYSPIIYLADDEPYSPIDFNEYINQALLKNVKTQKVFKPEVAFNAAIFGKWLLQYDELQSGDYTLFLPQGKHSPVVKESIPFNMSNIPLYVHTWTPPNIRASSKEVYISYTHMYAYNAAPLLFDCLPLNHWAHYADLEHLIIHTDRFGDVYEIYNSRHDGGVWLKPQECGWSQSHPLVFSARGSHATYNTMGKHWRFCAVPDVCDMGYRWFSNNLIRVSDEIGDMPDDLKWTHFKGNLGDGDIANFPLKHWWQAREKAGPYGEWCRKDIN